jgi:hypothetical protein
LGKPEMDGDTLLLGNPCMGAVSQNVWHRILSALDLFQFHGSPCGICGGQGSTGEGFLKILQSPL